MKNKILVGIILCVFIIGSVVFVNNFLHTQSKVDNSNRTISDKVDETQDNKEENDREMQDNQLQDSNEKSNDEIIGKWNAVSAVNAETGEKIENLRDIFGSSYSQYGSYIDLKSDGTFTDAIKPITNGSKVTTGTYEIKKDYNKQGDLYVFLTYSDGTEAKLQKVIIDDSQTFYLVLENFIDGYQFTFKK